MRTPREPRHAATWTATWGCRTTSTACARSGFGEEELAKPGSDRLVDALVAWGDDDTLRYEPARDARCRRGPGGDDSAHAGGPPRGPRHVGSPLATLVGQSSRTKVTRMLAWNSIAPSRPMFMRCSLTQALRTWRSVLRALDSLTNRVLEGIGGGAAQLSDACDGHGRISSIRWADQYGPMGGLVRLRARRPRPAAHRPPMR